MASVSNTIKADYKVWLPDCSFCWRKIKCCKSSATGALVYPA